MLSVSQLRSSYGRIEVLHGVSLEISAGEIVVVIGANGAGKTTLLHCLSGIQPIQDGNIVFRGKVSIPYLLIVESNTAWHRCLKAGRFSPA